ncbi:hypothetical protein Y032_0373g186 [Ancylostoma ceylanicum]|nr:hypothetical protein Y032_0373g186 [Ancylostoma ceylanicum]
MFHVHNFEWTFEARDLLSSTKWSAGGEEIAVDSRLNETDFVKTAQEFRTKKNRSRAPFVTGNLELMLNKAIVALPCSVSRGMTPTGRTQKWAGLSRLFRRLSRLILRVSCCDLAAATAGAGQVILQRQY